MDTKNSSSNASLLPPRPPPVWTRSEDKTFENALVKYPDGTSKRWMMIALELRGKSPLDVKAHYEALVHDIRAIESGMIKVPDYDDGREDGDGNQHDDGKGDEDRDEYDETETEVPEATISDGLRYKGRDSEIFRSTANCREKKRGAPWTIEEHKQVSYFYF